MKEDQNKNPFERLDENQEAPGALKGRVMSSISFINLLGDIGDLFTVKMGGTLGKMLESKEMYKDKE